MIIGDKLVSSFLSSQKAMSSGKLLTEWFKRIISVFAGDGFNTEVISLPLLVKAVVIQKIIGVNRHVPWPVDPTSRVVAPHKIIRGNRLPGYSKCCHIDGRNGIILGKNVRIGPAVKIISMNHSFVDYDDYENMPPIVIGDNCWLASDVKILAGVNLGNHVVVAAGSVVTKSFTENNILIAGAPARLIKKIPPYTGKRFQ